MNFYKYCLFISYVSYRRFPEILTEIYSFGFCQVKTLGTNKYK